MFGAIVSLIFFVKGKLILLFVLFYLSYSNLMSFLLTNLQASNAKKKLRFFLCWGGNKPLLRICY